jgi:hypothetical protein
MFIDLRQSENNFYVKLKQVCSQFHQCSMKIIISECGTFFAV